MHKWLLYQGPWIENFWINRFSQKWLERPRGREGLIYDVGSLGLEVPQFLDMTSWTRVDGGPILDILVH